MPWGERRLRAMRAVRNLHDHRAWRRRGPEAIVGPPPDPEAFLAGWTKAPWLLTPPRLAELAARWPEAWTARTRAEAEEILAGTYRWLGRTRDLGPRPRWRRETASEMDFPADWWSEVPLRSPIGAFDLKHLWEPNQHPAFVTLAKAFLLTGDARYRDHLTGIWIDWMDQNPPWAGPNAVSPLSTGLRLLHWSASLRFLAAREPPPDTLLRAIWPRVHDQRVFIARNLSRHSSANNHLIGELTSAFLTDLAFPGLTPAAATDEVERELRDEVFRQFHPDGGNREQAFHYHAFALAFALLAADAAERRGRRWPEDLRVLLRRATAFLEAGRLPAGNGPEAFLYGDSDESEVLPLAEGPRSLYAPLAAHGRLLAGDPPSLGPEGDERTAWLRGEVALPDPARPAPEPPPGAAFPDAGHAFLRRGPLEIHLNAGGLGYLSIAAHAHADALSVQVGYAGTPVVLDPGTYTYRGGNPWRDVLAGTLAHPTVSIEGRDQAERLGPFLWGRRYASRLTGASPGGERPHAEGVHDGYRNLGVVHRRRVELADPRTVIVEDVLEGAGERNVRLNWPLGPGDARVEASEVVLQVPGAVARLAVEGFPAEARLETGDPARPGSPCYSPGYDRLEAGQAAVWEARLPLPARWITRIRVTPS
jgi:hypothetical protein